MYDRAPSLISTVEAFCRNGAFALPEATFAAHWLFIETTQSHCWPMPPWLQLQDHCPTRAAHEDGTSAVGLVIMAVFTDSSPFETFSSVTFFAVAPFGVKVPTKVPLGCWTAAICTSVCVVNVSLSSCGAWLTSALTEARFPSERPNMESAV